MLERAERRECKGVHARGTSAEDLLVIKALATGETTAHHWYDALACDLGVPTTAITAIHGGVSA